MSATGIGASVKRTEDIRFITGKGHYVDDFNRPGQAYAYFLRSPHAHATIDKIDASAALKVAGGRRGPHRRRRGRRQDRRACRRGDGPFQGRLADESRRVIRRWRTARRSMSAIPSPSSSPILTPQARDGAEKLVVDYGVLPAVIDTASATKPGQPQVHELRPEQHGVQLAPRRQGPDRRGVCGGEARDQDRSRQQSHDPERDGAARSARRL